MAIIEAINQPRMERYLGILSAGPLEDLLDLHGPASLNGSSNMLGRMRVSPEYSAACGSLQCLIRFGNACKLYKFVERPSGLGRQLPVATVGDFSAE